MEASSVAEMIRNEHPQIVAVQGDVFRCMTMGSAPTPAVAGAGQSGKSTLMALLQLKATQRAESRR